jgi:peroxiredoxin
MRYGKCGAVLVATCACAFALTWAGRAFGSEAGASAGEAEGITAQEVLERMAEARARIRTAHYRLAERTDYMEPVYVDVMSPWLRDAPWAQEVMVAGGAGLLEDLEVTLCGDRFRLRTARAGGAQLLGVRQGITGSSSLNVCDGRRTWHADTTGTREACWLSLGAAGARPGPLRMGPAALQLFHVGPRFAAEQCPACFDPPRLAGTQQWHGQECHVLVETAGPLETRYWIDPERDWALVRMVTKVVSPETTQVECKAGLGWHRFGLTEVASEVSYALDASGLWRPSAWREEFAQVRDGERVTTIVHTGMVDEGRLNLDVPDSTFEYEPPDGTRVGVFAEDGTNLGYVWDAALSPGEREAEIERLVDAARARRQAGGRRYGRSALLEPPRIGEEAPDFEAETFSGDTLKLSDLRGKYVLLEFSSIGCPGCVQILPELKAIWQEFGADEQFAMVGLSVEPDEAAARAHAEESGMAWPQVHLGSPFVSPVVESYRVHGVPYLYLIGPDGRLLAKSPPQDVTKATVADALAGRLDLGAPDEPVTIGGRVVDTAAQPIESVAVTVDCPEAEPLRVSTDADGRWKAEVLGKHLPFFGLSLEHEGYLSPDGAAITDDVLHALLAGEAEFTMEKAARPRVLVLDMDGAPVPGAEVRAWPEPGRPRHEAATDQDGYAELRSVAPARCVLAVSAEGHAVATLEADLVADAQDVTVQLGPANVIRGRVVDLEGNPLAGAQLRVDIVGFVPCSGVWQAETDADGRFAWESAPPDAVDISVLPPQMPWNQRFFRVVPTGREEEFMVSTAVPTME